MEHLRESACLMLAKTHPCLISLSFLPLSLCWAWWVFVPAQLTVCPGQDGQCHSVLSAVVCVRQKFHCVEPFTLTGQTIKGIGQNKHLKFMSTAAAFCACSGMFQKGTSSGQGEVYVWNLVINNFSFSSKSWCLSFFSFFLSGSRIKKKKIVVCLLWMSCLLSKVCI